MVPGCCDWHPGFSHVSVNGRFFFWGGVCFLPDDLCMQVSSPERAAESEKAGFIDPAVTCGDKK